ncbi:MAG: DUF615 domain-containing protein [Azoarcus sp.]|jgi:ribosome-associated protein|nr:DUF615 domain-containing protein [Azoarcus sp.]
MVFHPDYSPDSAGEPPPSKSRRKREMHALQELGAQLVALPPEQLKKMPLPEALAKAIAEARRLPRRDEARRRQMQYIGKLMRGVDPEPLRARLDALRGPAAEVARQHRLERLRDDLLADEKTIAEIVREWPQADVQQLRALRRNALKERERQRPPRAYREVFKILRAFDAGRGEDADADADAPAWNEDDPARQE